MIGVYGGTFDPVHFGHLRTALEVKEFFCLDEIRLIPCSQPAHRELPSTNAEMRYEMLKLAVQKQAGMLIDRRELDRPGVSFMIDTLQSIRHEVKQKPLLLFIGTDAFEGLSGWRQWKNLFDYAHLVVITRPGYQSQDLGDFLSCRLSSNKEQLQLKQAGHLFFQAVTQLDISATMIRSKIKAGLNPGFLLPETVIDYIAQQRLYK